MNANAPGLFDPRAGDDGAISYDAAPLSDGDLSVSLAYLRDISSICAPIISYVSAALGGYVSVAPLPASWRDEIAACAPILSSLGDLARQGIFVSPFTH